MRNALLFAGAVVLSLIATSLWVRRLKATDDYDEGPTFWLTPWTTALAAILWVGWFMERFAVQDSN
jgi:hypothetical protein